MNDKCKSCNNKINIMIFRDQNYCSDLCRKALTTVTEATLNGGKNDSKRRGKEVTRASR